MQLYWELPPSSEWWYGIAVFFVLAVVVGAGEWIRSRFGWTPEFTRKLVHISVGLVIVFVTEIFTVPLPAILLAVIFMVVNFIAVRRGLLKSLHDTSRRTYGTVTYPLAFLILVMVFWDREPAIIPLSILVLALGDAAAAIVGESRRNPHVFSLTSDKKSVEGSIAMFAVSFLVLVGGLLLWPDGNGFPVEYVLACAGVAAATGTACEALSSRGLDNLTIPLSVAFVLSYYLIPNSLADVQQFTLGAAFGIFIAVISFKLRFLSLSGAVATFLLAVAVFGVGGWKWTIPLGVFFLLSSSLSKMGVRRKESATVRMEKSGTRDHAQVFANGGIAGILVLMSYWFPDWNLYPVFLGAIAAVTADTWGTEIGVLGWGRTVLITSLKSVERGANGGISVAGIIAGILGGLVIAASALPWIDSSLTLWIVLAGMTGSVLDSFLGATVQVRYLCPVCKSDTERRIHCNNQPTVHAGGFSVFTNDAVNWMCASAGAAVMMIVTITGARS